MKQSSLKLRYCCTDEETKAATELLTIEANGGSQTRALIVMSLILLFAVGLLVLKAAMIPAEHRWYLLLLVPFILILMHFTNRKNSTEVLPIEVELESSGLRFIAREGVTELPGKAFSKLLESDDLFVLAGDPVSITIPKRVIESKEDEACLRQLAKYWAEQTDREHDVQPTNPAAESSHHRETVQFQLSFRDYVDRTWASWQSRSIVTGLVLFVMSVSVFALLQPAPDAKIAPEKVFLFFMLPFCFVMALVIAAALTIRNWWSERGLTGVMSVAINEQGVAFSSQGLQNFAPWDQPPRYKETRRSFFLWWPKTKVWLQIPKQSFPSIRAANQCGGLLKRHGEPSSWFWY